MLAEARRRRRVARHDDYLVGGLDPEAECVLQRAVLHWKGDDADVAILIDDPRHDFVHIHPAPRARQPVDALHSIIDIDLPGVQHMPRHVAKAWWSIDVD